MNNKWNDFELSREKNRVNVDVIMQTGTAMSLTMLSLITITILH